MNHKQVIHDVVLILVTVCIVLAAWAFHEYDKRIYGEQMYHIGYEDATDYHKFK